MDESELTGAGVSGVAAQQGVTREHEIGESSSAATTPATGAGDASTPHVTPPPKRRRTSSALGAIRRGLSALASAIKPGKRNGSSATTPSSSVDAAEPAQLRAELERVAAERDALRHQLDLVASREKKTETSTDLREQLKNTSARVDLCAAIKDLVHVEVKRLLDEQKQMSVADRLVKDVDVEDEVNKIDPTLWDVICTLHKTKSEPVHCGRSVENKTNVSRHSNVTPSGVRHETAHAHIVERYATFLKMVFAASGRRLHANLHLKMQALLRHSTSEAVQILCNRMGFAVSRRTFERHLDQVKLDSKTWTEVTLPGIEEEIVTSYDNLDFEEGRRMKWAGKSSGGIHITTLQTSRPLPGLARKDLVDDDANIWKPVQEGTYVQTDFRKNEEEEEAVESFLDVLFESDMYRAGLAMTEEEQSEPHRVCFPRSPESVREGIKASPLKTVDTKSDILRTSAIDLNPDDEDNALFILRQIKKENKVGERTKFHVVAGDQKSVSHMVAIKARYPDEFEWLVPLMGDFHVMENFHACIFERFWELGLKQLANGNAPGNQVGGLGWSAANAESRLRQRKGKSYRHRHVFLTQTSEGVQQVAIESFLRADARVRTEVRPGDDDFENASVTAELVNTRTVREALLGLIEKLKAKATEEQRAGEPRDDPRSETDTERDEEDEVEEEEEEAVEEEEEAEILILDELMGTASEWLPEGMSVRKLRKTFECWGSSVGRSDLTFQGWIKYADMVNRTHRALYHAVEDQDWHLRLAALKEMWPYFRALNRTNYQRMVPEQLAMYAILPPSIKEFLRQGGFAVNMKGKKCGGDSMDGSHESNINRDVAAATSRTEGDVIMKETPRLTLIADAVASLAKAFVPSSDFKRGPRRVRKMHARHDGNVREVRRLLKQYGALKAGDAEFEAERNVHGGLTNVFVAGGTHHASQKEVIGTLNMLEEGQTFTDRHVESWYMCRDVGERSVRIRPKFNKVPVTPMREPPSETGRGGVQQYRAKAQDANNRRMHNVLAYHAKNPGVAFDPRLVMGQMDDVPRALFLDKGTPRKGNKSAFRSSVIKEFRDNAPLGEILESNHYPRGTTCVVVDAMHLVHKIMLMPDMQVFGDVARHVGRSWLQSYLEPGIVSVQFIFDDARQEMPEKAFVRRERDGSLAHEGESRECAWLTGGLITRETRLPEVNRKSAWKAMLKDREARQALIEFLCETMQDGFSGMLGEGQEVIISGAVRDGLAKRVSRRAGGRSESAPSFVTTYQNSHPEADTATYFHALMFAQEHRHETGAAEEVHVTVVSPDTDAFFIGLLAQRLCDDLKLGLHLTLMYRPWAQQKPPELIKFPVALRALDTICVKHGIPQSAGVSALVTAFIVGGCDFVSFIHKVPHGMLWTQVKKHPDFVCRERGTNRRLFGNGQRSVDFGQDAFEGFLRLIAAAYRAKHPRFFNAGIEAMHTDALESVNHGGGNAGGDEPVHGADDDVDNVVVPPALEKLLGEVRTNLYLPAIDLEARLPTSGALTYHFLRSRRVWERWTQFGVKSPNLSPLEKCGYERDEGGAFRYTLDSAQAQQATKAVLQYTMVGCRCTTGCGTMRCACRKSGLPCGPLCHVSSGSATRECTNLPNSSTAGGTSQSTDEREETEGGAERAADARDEEAGARDLEKERCLECDASFELELGEGGETRHVCPSCGATSAPGQDEDEEEEDEEEEPADYEDDGREEGMPALDDSESDDDDVGLLRRSARIALR